MASLRARLRPAVLPLLILLLALGVRCWDLKQNPPGFFRDEADKAVLPLLILLLALGVRCWDLEQNPPGFFRDEADKAVTAKSLLMTGRDLEGRRLPFFVRSLNVYTSGAYQYLLLPFILVLGMAEWVIRLPAALAGTATVAVTYLLGHEAYDRPTGLVAAGLLAISPWHVCLSRWANQGIFLPLGLSLAAYFLLRGRRPLTEAGQPDARAPGRGFRPFFLSALFLSLALYTYAPAKVLVPVFFVAVVGIYRRDFFRVVPERRWPYFYKYLGILLLFSLPMAYFTFFEAQRSALRFDRISIFSQAARPHELALLFFRGYLSHLSPAFLLRSGDANLRHSAPGVGQLLGPEGIALALGAYALLRRHRREDLLLLGWAALGLVPAALTREGLPHALRSLGALPAVQLIAAAGIVRSVEYCSPSKGAGVFRSAFPRKVVVTTWAAAFAFFAVFFLFVLFTVYPVVAAPWWEYGYAQAIEALSRQPGDFSEVVVSGWVEYPQIHFLYRTGADLSEYQKTRRIPGYRFLPSGQSYLDDYQRARYRSLYLLTSYDPVLREPLFQVNYPDGSPAWRGIEHPGATQWNREP